MLKICGERRSIQMRYNVEHNITPRSVSRPIESSLAVSKPDYKISKLVGDFESIVADMEREMYEAAERLDFERAALLRDQIRDLKKRRRGQSRASK